MSLCQRTQTGTRTAQATSAQQSTTTPNNMDPPVPPRQYMHSPSDHSLPARAGRACLRGRLSDLLRSQAQTGTPQISAAQTAPVQGWAARLRLRRRPGRPSALQTAWQGVGLPVFQSQARRCISDRWSGKTAAAGMPSSALPHPLLPLLTRQQTLHLHKLAQLLLADQQQLQVGSVDGRSIHSTSLATGPVKKSLRSRRLLPLNAVAAAALHREGLQCLRLLLWRYRSAAKVQIGAKRAR